LDYVSFAEGTVTAGCGEAFGFTIANLPSYRSAEDADEKNEIFDPLKRACIHHDQA